MPKSPDAFRTISEVADWLGVQAHVLRFWESKFSQVKPIKRAGGRRYYRPSDMLLLGGLKQVLHEDGLTIKGAQKLLREKGVAYVADMSQPLDDLTSAVIESDAEEVVTKPDETIESGTLHPFEVELADARPVGPEKNEEPAEVSEAADSMADDLELHAELVAVADVPEAEASPPDAAEPLLPDTSANADETAGDEQQLNFDASEDQATPVSEETTEAALQESPSEEKSKAEDVASEVPVMPSFRARSRDHDAGHDAGADGESHSGTEPEPVQESAISTGSTGQPEIEDAPEAPTDQDSGPFSVIPASGATDAPAKPRVIDVGPLPDLADFAASPSALSALTTVDHLTSEQADAIRPLLARLTRLRASMASPRKEIRKD